MKVRELGLPGVLLIEPTVHRDPRGHFLETWRRERYRAAGLPADFLQDNVSRSRRGVLRGLHFQCPRPQAKLISVLAGEAYDVAVDVRVGSPTFGRWTAAILSAENGRQLFIPEGFAHGFVVSSDEALVAYKCTDVYVPEAELVLRWDDPALDIDWPVRDPVVSDRDRAGRRLSDIPVERLPTYGVLALQGAEIAR